MRLFERLLLFSEVVHSLQDGAVVHGPVLLGVRSSTLGEQAPQGNLLNETRRVERDLSQHDAALDVAST